MKRILGISIIFAACVSCTPSAEKIKEQCLKDTDNQVFYGERTKDYCDCLYQKLKVAEVDKIPLTEAYVDSVKTECDADFTTMDTDF